MEWFRLDNTVIDFIKDLIIDPYSQFVALLSLLAVVSVFCPGKKENK